MERLIVSVECPFFRLSVHPSVYCTFFILPMKGSERRKLGEVRSTEGWASKWGSDGRKTRGSGGKEGRKEVNGYNEK